MANTSNKTVSIIVVTCGIGGYLNDCLESLKGQTHPYLEIIVIDNSCDSHFNLQMPKAHPDVRFYISPVNLFYCESLNKGINLSKGDFVLCLNDDVILDKKFIEEALSGFLFDSKIGMVSGKVLRRDRKTIDSTGLFLSPWRTAKERGYNRIDKGKFNTKEYVFGVTGAVGFYRRQMLEEIKEDNDYFDSDFCFFYEDLDLAWRAQRAGWRCYYVPSAIAYHVRGGSARSVSGLGKPYARRYINDELQAHLIKNRYLTIIKNESLPGILLHAPFIFVYDLISWIYIFIFRPRQIKTFLLNIKYLKSALKKRQKFS